jgi:predicted HAD superfamily Cof-like phosphohydrolase
MNSGFEDVSEFHAKFGIPTPGEPTMLTPDVKEFRLKFLLEELAEYERASTRWSISSTWRSAPPVCTVSGGRTIGAKCSAPT